MTVWATESKTKKGPKSQKTKNYQLVDWSVVDFLHAVLLLQLQVLLPEGVDGVNHDLDQLDLGVSQPVLVGDIVGVASLTTGLSTGAARLDCQLFSASLQRVNAVLGPAGQVDVDGGPHAGAEVGGAGVDVSVLLGQSVLLAGLGLDGLLDSL